MCNIKMSLFFLVIFTLFVNHHCGMFGITRISRPYEFSIDRMSLPEIKPISIPEYKPISIPEFKPISIPEFKPVSVPEFKPISIDFDWEPPSFPRDDFQSMPSSSSRFDKPSLEETLRISNELNLLRPSRRPSQNRQKSKTVGPRISTENKASDSKPRPLTDDEELNSRSAKPASTRRPHGKVATRNPLSGDVSPPPETEDNQERQPLLSPSHHQEKPNILNAPGKIIASDVGPSFTPYHYTAVDAGYTSLGLYLADTLEKWATSSRFNSENYPLYRYRVYHYYHNRELVPEKLEIRSENIVDCSVDIRALCPIVTTTLCTLDGKVMCVATNSSTLPCSMDSTSCIQTTIDCTNNPAVECRTLIEVPCIANATVYGDIQNNGKVISANSQTAKYFTKYFKITTPTVETKAKRNHVAQEKGEEVQNFCVGIVFSPAKLPKLSQDNLPNQ